MKVYIDYINLVTAFQVMTTFMPPPPAATFLAFHPQDNNIIAVGMEDSSIQIYNVRVDEVRHLEFSSVAIIIILQFYSGECLYGLSIACVVAFSSF